jgi:hypothetical protein
MRAKAKRTMERALAATRKRHAHQLARDPNVSGTEFPNEPDKALVLRVRWGDGRPPRLSFSNPTAIRVVLAPNGFVVECRAFLATDALHRRFEPFGICSEFRM